MRRTLHLTLALGALGACGSGTIGGDDFPDANCLPNEAPGLPEVMAPVTGRIDVVPDQLVIQTSAFRDWDASDIHGASEFEIWTEVDGEADVMIWDALIEGAGDPRLTQVTLADGDLIGMTEWTDYLIRARYRDDRGECSQWSPWSDYRKFRTDDGSTALYDPTVVRDVYLTIPQATWNAIDAQAVPPGCVPYTRDYYTASMMFEGQTLDGIGIHIKGGCGSARHMDGKASFKVKFDWDDPALAGCPIERRLFGQKHFTLNNNVQDQTMQHERMAYELYRELGIPGPRSASVRLHVNGQYWGVYTNVESIDRRFLDRWFASKGGMLYEGTYWCDLIPANVPTTIDDSGCLTREFTPDACDSPPGPGDDPIDYTLLREMVLAVEAMPAGSFYPAIEQIWEFDDFLTIWAIESVISHWDAYEFSIMNNYRVYHDPSTDKWSLISTGVDQTFLGDQDPWGVSGVIANRCRQEPACEAAFAAKLDEVNQHFAVVNMAARAQTIHDQISPDVLTDPRKEYDNSTYANAYSELLTYIANRPARVDQHLAAHGF